MKTPIELEFRVTYEQRNWGDETAWMQKAAEFTVLADAEDFAGWLRSEEFARYVQIEQREPTAWVPRVDLRPTPPVELPTEPTLGWAIANFGSRLIATSGGGRGGVDIHDGGYVDSQFITAFTPAVAVPKAALDELRAGWGGCERTIGTFLAAVDEANRA